MNELLEQQASAIETFLARHGVQVRIEGGTLSPRLVSYNLTLGPGVRSGRVAALTTQLAHSLAVGSVRLARHGDSIALEVPRADPSTVRLLPLYHQLSNDDDDAMPHATALLGLDYEGTPLLLRLVSPEVANLLLLGTAGSGKTSLLHGMIASLALSNGPDELQLMLIDAGRKRRAGVFNLWQDLPHLLSAPINDPVEAAQRLAWLGRQMEWRAQDQNDGPTIVVFIDELPDLLAATDSNFERLFLRLLQRGREGGIHFVVGATNAGAIQPLITDTNFPARLVGRLASVEDAEVLTGARASQAERLLNRGDFLVQLRGELTRLQAGYVSEKEIVQLVRLTAQIAAERAEQEAATHRTSRRGNLSSVPVADRSGRSWQLGGGGMGAASPLPASPAPRNKGILDQLRRKQ